MQQHDQHRGGGAPAYLLADMRTRPTGHSQARASAPFIAWATAGRASTAAVERARRVTLEQLGEVDLERYLPVPERLVLRLALPAAPGTGRPETVILNHAHVWAVFDGVARQRIELQVAA